MKCYKKLKATKSGSGYKTIRKYIFYDQLQFLSKSIEPNTTSSSLTEEENIEMVDDQIVGNNSDKNNSQYEQNLSNNPFNPTISTSGLATSQALPERKQAPAKRPRRDDFETKLLKILEQPQGAPKVSEDKLFFDSTLPAVEKLDEDIKLQFRVEVLQLLQRFKRNQTCATSTNTFAATNCPPSFATTQPFGSNYSQQVPPTYHTLYPQTSTPHSCTSTDSSTTHYPDSEY